MKALFWALLWALTPTGAGAQLSSMGEPEFVRLQREALQQQQQAVMLSYQTEASACWQKFAVNGCLGEARKIRRTAMAPLQQQELLLNAQARQWQSEQRQQRLDSKSPEAGRLP